MKRWPEDLSDEEVQRIRRTGEPCKEKDGPCANEGMEVSSDTCSLCRWN